MKRIDLHIHTLATPLDDEFEFSKEALRQHVERNALSAIAVTNHNLFDFDNYKEVCSVFPEGVCVLPGIEVSVKGFHVLVIASPSDAEEFNRLCQGVPLIKQGEEGLAIEGFKSLFGDGRFIVIPHYKKKPAIPECDLVALGDVVTALEVSSEKKWSHEYARVDKPVVLFSDYRCKPGACGAFGKYTYASIGDLSFESLRLAFGDKAKFSITGKEAHMELEPNLYASMGLNVVIGGRSSGKTFFLDRINDSCDPDDVVYVRQFDIVKDAGEKTFREKLLDEEAAIKSDYYEPMKAISTAALKLPSRDAVAKEIKDYLACLEAFAVTSAREDEFSKCPIYSEGRIAMKSAEPEKKIVEAIIALLAENPLEKEIEEVVGRDKLLELLRISMSRYKDKALECRLIGEANKIAQAVRGRLSIESSRPECPTSPMVGAAKRSVYVNRLAKLRELTKGETVVSSKAIGKFRRVVKRVPYKNANAFKTAIATSSNMAGVLQKPDEDFVEDLLAAKGVSDVSRAFFDMAVTLENERGEEVSGGQHAEYLFFRALERAASHDVVLIDEPESSFDNMFLNDLIAGTLKEISKKSTVFIATHNNVLGVSIKPDGIVYADVEDGMHRIFTCDSGDELMRSSDGSTVKRSEILLRFMEAGGRAYKDRRPYYGLA